MSKIKVPEGMLEAALPCYLQDREMICSVLTSALEWLADNPIVPTLEQTEEMRRMFRYTDKPLHVYRDVAVEWQRRMFLAPEPEILKDGTVEYANGTYRPVAIWWEGARWPISTISSHSEPLDDLQDLLVPIRNLDEAHHSTILARESNSSVVAAYWRGRNGKNG